MDVSLACEGHVKGLAFVTADKKVQKDFGYGLKAQGVTMYTIDGPWMESGMTTPPPEMKIGR